MLWTIAFLGEKDQVCMTCISVMTVSMLHIFTPLCNGINEKLQFYHTQLAVSFKKDSLTILQVVQL